MVQDLGRKNTLIVQGRLLKDRPQDAIMSISDWFVLYQKLLEEDLLNDDQVRIVADLAQHLTAVQLAAQLKASADTSKERA